MEKSKYNSINEWRAADPKAYTAARTKDLLDKICEHFGWKRIIKPIGYWTLERCKEQSVKYSTKSEWYKNDSKSYHAAHRKGWLDECSKHMENIKKPNGYWTREKCIEEALKYKTIKEWEKKNSSSYVVAKSIKCLDECTKHMSALIKPSGYWTLEKCQEEALKYKTITEWEKKIKPLILLQEKKVFLISVYLI